ncbi:unnamed protein product [Heterotrigona itama]|uniref:Endonuclease/exonuclease/phosphatase domain-containing protein n=1 Tax=Heterotrigona itama TaxID=395501 RepID=A0A6V7H2E5_9HYME|nr:unnamed protein product [Heterotrigona itama]
MDGFAAFLDEASECALAPGPRPVTVLEDFNAHTTTSGSPKTNTRGRMVVKWVAGLKPRLFNRGASCTCVEWREDCTVDLTWANSTAARRVTAWERDRCSGQAEGEVDALSRCSFTHCNEDLLLAAAIAVTWGAEASPMETADAAADRLGSMTQACPTKRIGAMYWWTEELSNLRKRCILFAGTRGPGGEDGAGVGTAPGCPGFETVGASIQDDASEAASMDTPGHGNNETGTLNRVVTALFLLVGEKARPPMTWPTSMGADWTTDLEVTTVDLPERSGK